jgi:DNA-binding LacI/PurR family transcriptional regulator
MVFVGQPSARPTMEVPFPDGAGGRACARDLLARREPPDAIAYANDELSAGRGDAPGQT